MLRAFFSNIFPTLRHASVEISERAAFIRALDAWRAESPRQERDSRNRSAIELTEAFDTNSPSFCFHGNISSIPRCIGNLLALQKLPLDYCEKLTDLPPEIGNLHSLQDLNLPHCTRLTSLPPEIGNLHTLQVLDLDRCRSLTSLPPEIGNLTRLRHLNLSGCWRLTSLPPEIGNLTGLRNLVLSNCTNLTSLPPEIGNLHALQDLNLYKCESLTSLPPETITFEDSHPLERQEFIETFKKFLALLTLFGRRYYVADELITADPGVLQATGRFVKSFKERIIENRLQNMQKELSKTHDAIASLREDPQTDDTLKADDRGLALPLIILECFIAEDARVRCLRLQQESEEHLLQKRN